MYVRTTPIVNNVGIFVEPTDNETPSIPISMFLGMYNDLVNEYKKLYEYSMQPDFIKCPYSKKIMKDPIINISNYQTLDKNSICDDSGNLLRYYPGTHDLVPPFDAFVPNQFARQALSHFNVSLTPIVKKKQLLHPALQPPKKIQCGDPKKSRQDYVPVYVSTNLSFDLSPNPGTLVTDYTIKCPYIKIHGNGQIFVEQLNRFRFVTPENTLNSDEAEMVAICVQNMIHSYFEKQPKDQCEKMLTRIQQFIPRAFRNLLVLCHTTEKLMISRTAFTYIAYIALNHDPKHNQKTVLHAVISLLDSLRTHHHFELENDQIQIYIDQFKQKVFDPELTGNTDYKTGYNAELVIKFVDDEVIRMMIVVQGVLVTVKSTSTTSITSRTSSSSSSSINTNTSSSLSSNVGTSSGVNALPTFPSSSQTCLSHPIENTYKTPSSQSQSTQVPFTPNIRKKLLSRKQLLQMQQSNND